MCAMSARTYGVEEELLLINPETGEISGRAAAVAGRAGIDVELTQEQVEVQTSPHSTYADMRADLFEQRVAAQAAAATAHVAVAAMATCPTRMVPTTTRNDRYLRMSELYGLTAREQLTCGMHVHVGIESPDEGVAVIDRIRPWLAVLLALSANSPFWQGQDTGYASYRSRLWYRWPSAGPTPLFGTPEAYDECVSSLVSSGVLLDRKMAYFDARLAESFPTVEIRVADVCRRVDHAVLVATLARALVETAARAWRRGEPPAGARVELLRLAAWRAARSGLAGDLVDVEAAAPVRAMALVERLVAHVSDVLREMGELDLVRGHLEELSRDGTGSTRQRAAYERSSGSLQDVALDAVRATLV